MGESLASSYARLMESSQTGIEINSNLFCVPEYSETPNGLRIRLNTCVFVRRKRLVFSDGDAIAYVCSCPGMVGCRERLDSIHHYSKTDTHDMVPCVHALAVPKVRVWSSPIRQIDDIVQLIDDIFVVMGDTPIALKRTPRGVVLCTVCSKKSDCHHVRRLDTVALQYPEFQLVDVSPAPGVPPEAKRGISQDAIRVPQQKIQLAPVPSTKKRRPDRCQKFARVYDVGSYRQYEYAKDETVDGLRATKVDHVFRYSKEVWFTHRLVHLYLDTAARGNPCFDAFYHTMRLQYARGGQDFCSKSTTRVVLQAALYHLDLDEKKILRCDKCSAIPTRHRIFILDGTSNGFLNRTKVSRYATDEDRPNARTPRPGKTFALVVSTKDRALVLSSLESPDSFDRAAYLRGLRNVAVPGLISFVEHALDHSGFEDVVTFLKDISSPYPITATVQHHMVLPRGQAIMDRIYAPISTDDRDCLRKTFPSLSRLLTNFVSAPGEWAVLLRRIQNLAIEIYMTTDREHHSWTRTNEEHPHVCFPEFPRIRENAWPRVASTYEASCTKHALQHRHFSPGLFLICCPHGTILGYCAMQEYESVHTAFEMIVERFEIPPGMIIYDNACNLYRYGMMRCPAIFSQIRFMIDNFHSTGHIMCQPSFRFRHFPDDVAYMLGHINGRQLNTQAVEQTNSKLRRFQNALGFMTQENYISFIRVISCLLNLYM